MAKRKGARAPARDPDGPCPCGTGETYQECCGRLHRGAAAAATAEQLMRSRFSAFAVGDAGYLLRSWHSTTRPARLTLDPRQRWTRLEIVGTERGGLFDTAGTVEFRAHHQESGTVGVQHERSRFVREDGRWTYLNGLPDGG